MYLSRIRKKIILRKSKAFPACQEERVSANMGVVSLDPQPLAPDLCIENLRRLELRVLTWTIENGKTNIKVLLSGEQGQRT
jgi:hypothetical protein